MIAVQIRVTSVSMEKRQIDFEWIPEPKIKSKASSIKTIIRQIKQRKSESETKNNDPEEKTHMRKQLWLIASMAIMLDWYCRQWPGWLCI